VKAHSSYSEDEWSCDEAARVRGEKLECPDCGSFNCFGPRAHTLPDGSRRLYRACKHCGFWQEADGSPPYRVWLALHICCAPLQGDGQTVECASCGQVAACDVASGWRHNCGKFLRPSELGFHCTNCDTFIGRAYDRPLGSTGSG